MHSFLTLGILGPPQKMMSSTITCQVDVSLALKKQNHERSTGFKNVFESAFSKVFKQQNYLMQQ